MENELVTHCVTKRKFDYKYGKFDKPDAGLLVFEDIF